MICPPMHIRTYIHMETFSVHRHHHSRFCGRGLARRYRGRTAVHAVLQLDARTGLDFNVVL